MSSRTRKIDTASVKAALPFPTIVSEALGELHRLSDREFSAICPFHTERTPSFTIYRDHGHCFGCGWHGDIFQFFQDYHSKTFVEAYEELERKAGLGGLSGGEIARPKVKVAALPASEPKKLVKPSLPPFRKMSGGEMKRLADLRGLDPLGINAASQAGLVWSCDWPQWQRNGDGAWMPGSEVSPSWVVTDPDRWVAQFRRFDGETYRIKYRESGRESHPKSLTKGAARWPLGAGQIGDRVAVLFCEGGSDMLAAFHFLVGFGLLDRVAVVGRLGGGGIAPEAWPLFRGKRVRIMMDSDTWRENKRSGKLFRPGWENAKRWQDELTAAGAAVECFLLDGLKTATGEPVGDLNDLAYCDARTLDSDEMREPFFAWDF